MIKRKTLPATQNCLMQSYNEKNKNEKYKSSCS